MPLAFSNAIGVYIHHAISCPNALVDKTTKEVPCHSDATYTTSEILKGAEIIQAMPLAWSNHISVYHQIHPTI
jgi:hypothetical protein